MRKRYVSLLLCFILGFCLFALPAAAETEPTKDTVTATYGETVNFTVPTPPYSSDNPEGLYLVGENNKETKVDDREVSIDGNAKTMTCNLTGLDVGSYVYKARCSPSSYIYHVYKVTVNPKSLECTAQTEPTAETLRYTGEAQALVSAGEGGSQTGAYSQTVATEIEYALGENDTDVPTDGWRTTVPTATNAGSYYVWWRVVPKSVSGQGAEENPEANLSPEVSPETELTEKAPETVALSLANDGGASTYSVGNYAASTPSCISASIALAEIDADITIGKMTYTGAPQTPPVTVTATTVDGCDYTVTYSTDGENYSAELPTFTDVGTYKLYVKFSAPNHEDAEIYDDEVTVQAPATATPAPTAQPKAPNTADEANGALWLALAMLSLMGIAVVARKKAR